MSHKNFRTVWDAVNEGANLRASCGACPHWSIIDAKQLGRKVQVMCWTATLEAIATRLRCTRCGHRGGYLRARFGAVTGPKVGPVDEAEARAWAKMMRG